MEDVIRDIQRQNLPKVTNQTGRHYNYNKKYELLPGIGYRVDTRPTSRKSIIDNKKINKILREKFTNTEWVVSEGDEYLYTHSEEHRNDMRRQAENQYYEEKAQKTKKITKRKKSKAKKSKVLSSSSEEEYEGDNESAPSEISSQNSWTTVSGSRSEDQVAGTESDGDDNRTALYIGLEQPVVPSVVPFPVAREPEEEEEFLLKD